MKRSLAVLLAAWCFSCMLPDRGAAEQGTHETLIVTPSARETLDKINGVDAYEVPDLPLQVDEIYAGTAADVKPFWHVEPFKKHFLEQMEYTGPGRAYPEPEDIETVKIGFIGPIEALPSVATGDRTTRLGKKMHKGCLLAVKQANERGGYIKRGVPFELMVHNDNGLWGASGNELVDMAYREKVWAVIGTIDGANSHIAIRVALKAELPVMNSGDTDPTFIETNIPWVFRCIGDDRKMAYLMVDYLYRVLDLKRVGIIRVSNRYGRFGVREVRDSSRRLGRPIRMEMAYELGLGDFTPHLTRLDNQDLQAIVHWGNAREGAIILNQMRAMGMDQLFVACDRCLSDAFLSIAGENAEGVICGSPWNPSRRSERLEAFREAFRAEFGEEPETYAAHAYDGVNMLIWAIQTAGLNRARIRDVLAHRREPWPGVTGDIVLSAALDDSGPVYLAERRDGEWTWYSRKALPILKMHYRRP